jgi:lipopolysaccharide transport system permease protein
MAVTTSANPAPFNLPERPFAVIESSKYWVPLNLRDLWAYRELLYFLTWRDIKVRYKQTLLGATWAILQPLLTMLIFTVLFGRLAGFGLLTGGVPYPLFAFAGLLPWTFFSSAITSSGNSVVNSAHLITKVYFPRMIIPAAAVGAALVDFANGLLLLVVLMFYYRVTPTSNLFLLPVLIVLTALLALGVGMWLSALNVKYRDIRFTIPFLVQVWMFVSPIIYPSGLIPARFRWLFSLNPLTGIIDGYRSALFGHQINWQELGISASIAFVLFIFALYAFRRMERDFADII